MERHRDWLNKHNFVGVSMHTEKVNITAKLVLGVCLKSLKQLEGKHLYFTAAEDTYR